MIFDDDADIEQARRKRMHTPRAALAVLARFAHRRDTTRDVPNRPPRVIFSVTDGPNFPRELWTRFRAATEAQGEKWIDALRRLIEGYIREHDKGTDHEGKAK